MRFLQQLLSSSPRRVGRLQDHEGQSLISDIDCKDHSSSRGNPTALRITRLWPAWALITGTNMLLFAASIAIAASARSHRFSTMNYLAKQTSFYSPILDRFEIPTLVKKVNGSLFEGPNASLHRQLPSAEVETFWKQFDRIYPFPVSRAELVRMGRDPDVSVRFHDSLGLGPDAYMGHFDVFHQIHCLNALRKAAFQDYAPYPTNAQIHQPKLKYVHLAHCVDILVQNLMCQPNVDLVTFNWVETQSIPYPDFNINHQCRDWDAIAGWLESNSIPPESWVGMNKTDDVRWIAQEEGYFEIFGHDEHDHDRIVSSEPFHG